MGKLIKFIIYYFFSRIIILSLVIHKLFKKKIIYGPFFGFGDFVVTCYTLAPKINKNKKILCFSQLQYETAIFFFEKRFIQKTLILLPKFLNESHIGYNFLNKSRIFRPSKMPIWTSPDKKIITHADYFHRKKELTQYVIKRIKEDKVSKKIIEILKKPTLLIFIKNFSINKNNHINFQVRQTRNLDKIYKLLNYFQKIGINIIVLGTKYDHFVQIISKKIKKKKIKNIYLLKDLSKNYSINDQIYVASRSIGYCGSASGADIMSRILMKKLIIIDAPYWFADKYCKNCTYLYKKIYNKKTKKEKIFKWQNFYDPKEHYIIENSYHEIKSAIKKKILTSNYI